MNKSGAKATTTVTRSGSGLSAEQVQSREDDLHSGLEQLAALVVEALSLQDLLGEVARAAADAIPRADGVGVTLLRLDKSENRVEVLGASHPFVEQINVIQYEIVDEGPCITAARERQIMISPVVGADARWPRFGPRVARLGVRGVLSLPMLLPDDTVVGALNCYSRADDAFDEHGAGLGATFAIPAAVAVHNSHMLARAHTHAEQLETAMITRATIDQAIGIIRSRSGATVDEAFARLRAVSQSENVKLSIVAERFVDEAVRRAQARHGRSMPDVG